MNLKEKEFTENKVANLLQVIAMYFFIGSLLSSVIFAFFSITYAVMILLSAILASAVLTIIGGIFSKKQAYTRDFLERVNKLYDECETVDECEKLLEYFQLQATNGQMYVLSFPADLNILHSRIKDKLRILKRLDKSLKKSKI